MREEEAKLYISVYIYLCIFRKSVEKYFELNDINYSSNLFL